MKIKRIQFALLSARNGALDETHEAGITDMLRYDIAFRSKLNPRLIAFPVFATSTGDLGGRVTTDRWRSFGLRLELTPSEPVKFLSTLNLRHPTLWVGSNADRSALNPDDFMTFRYFVPDTTPMLFTLAQFIAAKDTRELETA